MHPVHGVPIAIVILIKNSALSHPPEHAQRVMRTEQLLEPCHSLIAYSRYARRSGLEASTWSLDAPGQTGDFVVRPRLMGWPCPRSDEAADRAKRISFAELSFRQRVNARGVSPGQFSHLAASRTAYTVTG